MYKKQNGDYLINKLDASIRNYQNGLIDKQSEAYKPIKWEIGGGPCEIYSFREYKGKYLISFTGSLIQITEGGCESFRLPEMVRALRSYNDYRSNVDLRDDKLYFVDLNYKLNRVDLAELLSLTDKWAYRATVLTSTAIIDFCVSADHTVTTVTEFGVITNLKTGHSINASTNLAYTRFSTIKQLGTKIVTASFCPCSPKYYIVYDTNLKELASAAISGETSVNNMELFERDGRLWILAANIHKTVDYLVLYSDKLVLVQTLVISNDVARTHGLIWKEVGKEALVFGVCFLKSFKL